ncbi:Dehydrogenase xptC [Fusarium oxysporum f. sp. albedinis]|nr:Dehydrogenase xptC [Fusarium oxysporum f. sp. albedinis]
MLGGPLTLPPANLSSPRRASCASPSGSPTKPLSSVSQYSIWWSEACEAVETRLVVCWLTTHLFLIIDESE